MRFTRTATLVAAVSATLAMAAPAQASPDTSQCLVTAFGHSYLKRCGSNSLKADWNGDKSTDDVFFTSTNYYVYRVSATSGGPVRVSEGKAATMVRWEVRPGGYHRIYAATLSGRVYWSQLSANGWSDWYLYVP